MNTTETILRRAYELVASGWCQGTHAKTKNGAHCSWQSDKACEFCLTGAISKAWSENFSNGSNGYTATFKDKPSMIGAARDAVRKAIPYTGQRCYSSLATWNDDPNRKQVDVLRALKRAILKEGEK